MKFTLKFFYSKKIKKIIINTILASINSASFIFSFFFLIRFINAILSQESISDILISTLLTILFSILSYFLNYVYKHFYKKHLMASVLELYEYFISKMTRNNPKKFEEKTPQEYIYTSYEASTMVSNFFFEPIYLIIEYGIKFLGILALLFYFNWVIALISIFASICLVTFFYWSLLKKERIELKNIAIEEKNHYTLENYINNHDYFYRFNKSEKWSKFLNEKIKQSHLKIYKNTKKMFKLEIYEEIIVSVFSFIPIITLGLFSYYNLFGVNFELFVSLSLLVSVWMYTVVAIFQIVPNYDAAKNISKKFDIAPYKIEENNEIIFFNKLSIFDNKNSKTLHFDENKKIKIAIIGKSGSGKTTLIENMMNYNLESNYTILWNDKKVDKINQESIRKNITYIDFNNYLFDGTVKDNITLFDSVDDKKVYEILKLVNLDYLKINQNIKNINLSQGEIQRLKLSRAFFYKKNIIILDEAFNNIEPSLATKIKKQLISEHNCYIEVSHLLSQSDLSNYDYVVRVQDA